MHSGIVNGYQVLCHAHTVLEQHMGTAALFLFYLLSSFFAVFFLCGSIVGVNNLKRTADYSLVVP